MPKRARNHKGKMIVAMNHGAGYKSLREVFVAKQVVAFFSVEERRETLDRIVDLPIYAPFPVRSALLTRCPNNGIETMVEGIFYSEPLTSENLPPHSTSQMFVFWKDQRRKWWGSPISRKTFGTWIFSSREEYEQIKK